MYIDFIRFHSSFYYFMYVANHLNKSFDSNFLTKIKYFYCQKKTYKYIQKLKDCEKYKREKKN